MYKRSRVQSVSVSQALLKGVGNSLGCAQSLLPWLTALTIMSTVSIQSKAVQAPDGTVAFESAVLLVDTHATFLKVKVRQAIYYFDLELPDNVGESLQKVMFQQRTGGNEIKFRLDKTKAYLGDHHHKQEQLNLVTSQDETTGAITVEFDRPIAPGNKLTIALKPKRNPNLGGAYSFGVTAFPAGDKSRGMYLGAGRFQFRVRVGN